MGKKQLVDLQINEVSGVDKAANLRTFLVIKSENSTESFTDKIKKAVKAFGTSIGITKEVGGAQDLYSVLQAQEAKEAKWDRHDAMYNLFYPLMDSVDSICADATCVDKITAVKTSLQQFSDLILSSGIVKNDGYVEALKTFAKEFATITDPEFISKTKFSVDSMHIEAMQQCVDMVKSYVEALPDPVSKSNGNEGGVEMTPEEIKKAVDEQVAKALADKNAENVLLKQQVADLQKAQADQISTLQKAAFVSIAKDLKGIEGDADKLGGLLHKCSTKLEKADYDALESILKSAQARITEGDLLKEVGGSGENPSKGSDAKAKVDAKATELMTADPKLTKEQAFVKALSADPKLYAEYAKSLEA